MKFPEVPPVTQRALGLAVLCSAASLLAFEVVLTRITSAFFFTHLTALLLAGCLAVLGLGAAFLHRWAAVRPVSGQLLLWLTALGAFSGVVAMVCAVNAPFLFLAGAFAGPFFLAGAFAAGAYRLSPAPSTVFALEALGGASGAFLGPWLLTTFGDVAAAFLALALLVPAALALLPAARNRRPLWLLAPLVVLLPAQLATPGGLLCLDPLATPGARSHLVEQTLARHGQVVRTRTDSYARTDLVQTDERWVRYLYTDRMYVARVVRWDGRAPEFPDAEANTLARLKRLPFGALHRARVLVLGAGGGYDVAMALQGGASEIDAVEVNAAMLSFVRELGAFCGRVYDRPEVRVHADEARRFLRASTAQWDLVQLSLMQTDPAVLHSLAGVQNWVMTREAVLGYFEHLSPGGTLAVVQNTPEIADRTIATLTSALVARGVAAASVAEHLVVLALPDQERNPFSQLLLARAVPFTAGERAALAASAAAVGARLRTAEPRPGAFGVPTDARPFFYEPHPILVALYAVLALGALLAIWRLFVRPHRRSQPLARRSLLLAMLLGAGLMLAQAALLADAQFLLGFPPLAVAWTVGGLLAASALGALLALRLPWSSGAVLRGAALCAVVALLGLGLVGPTAPLAIATPPALAHLWVALLVLPLGLVVGPCFPALLQQAGGADGQDRAALYAVDGLGAVVGGGAAVLLAAFVSTLAVALAAAGCYALVALLAGPVSRAASSALVRYE
ncbi:MAG: hypothetical protein WCO56_04985 [Verrucomicrobiota bacterium]